MENGTAGDVDSSASRDVTTVVTEAPVHDAPVDAPVEGVSGSTDIVEVEPVTVCKQPASTAPTDDDELLTQTDNVSHETTVTGEKCAKFNYREIPVTICRDRLEWSRDSRCEVRIELSCASSITNDHCTRVSTNDNGDI